MNQACPAAMVMPTQNPSVQGYPAHHDLYMGFSYDHQRTRLQQQATLLRPQDPSHVSPSVMCNYRAIQRMDDEPREVRQGEEYQAVSIPEFRPRPKKLDGEEAARLAAEPILQPGGCGPAAQPAPIHSHPLPQELHACFGIRSMGTAGLPLSVLNA